VGFAGAVVYHPFLSPSSLSPRSADAVMMRSAAAVVLTLLCLACSACWAAEAKAVRQADVVGRLGRRPPRLLHGPIATPPEGSLHPCISMRRRAVCWLTNELLLADALSLSVCAGGGPIPARDAPADAVAAAGQVLPRVTRPACAPPSPGPGGGRVALGGGERLTNDGCIT
jgi:hypothetical protein